MRASLVASILVIGGALLGCGGGSATRPVTQPATRAERLDGQRPARAEHTDGDAAERVSDGVRGGWSPESVEEEEIADLEPEPDDAPEPLYHVLRRGQTLYSVARMYDVPVADLMQANAITDPTKVPANRPILIPGRAPSAPAPSSRSHREGQEQARSGSPESRLTWPLHGAVTGAYGQRGRHSRHSGIDIDGRKGDPILAAASGTVLRAGQDGEYGRVVILDHGHGLTTWYAHASRLLVSEGERVRRGELIAEVGASGNAHGTHLHFEVRKDDRPTDPLPFLRPPDLLTAGTH